MDVSYSAWRHSTKESLVLKGDSFSFLFDRRYTNRLNRMSRVFFEAYSKATKELAAQEDRFPSLSEIDAKMESGAVYAFKDRLTKNTEFFEEIKISGVSYLVPRALQFVDLTGVYTDLVFNFNEGTVILPTRRKVPAPIEMADEPREESLDATISMPASVPVEEAPQKAVPTAPTAAPITAVSAASSAAGPIPKEAGEAPRFAASADAPIIDEPIEEPEITTSEPATMFEERKPEPFAADLRQNQSFARPTQSPSEVSPPSKKDIGHLPAREKPGMKAKPLILTAVAILILLSAGAYYIFAIAPEENEPVVPRTPVAMVQYTAFLSNASTNTTLGLNIKNPDEMDNVMELVLPQNISSSISAMGGVVTIAHADSTFIKMASKGDAQINVLLNGNWTAVPVLLNLTVPEEYDASLAVHGGEYDLNRKDNSILLRFNCTQDGVVFEQTYTARE